MKTASLGLISTCIFAIYLESASNFPSCFAQERNLVSDDSKILLTGFPFSVWLVKILPPKENGVKIRNIYIYLEAIYFTEENIKSVVTKITSEEPKRNEMLDITIFSDKEMLRRAINITAEPICRRFVDTPEGRKAEEEFYQKYYPLDTGYFRAFYHRKFNGKEILEFSPYPETKEYIIIPLY